MSRTPPPPPPTQEEIDRLLNNPQNNPMPDYGESAGSEFARWVREAPAPPPPPPPPSRGR